MVYSNQNSSSKRFKTWRYYLPKDKIKKNHVIINGKNFYDQAIDSDIKQFEETRKKEQDKVKIILLDVY